MLKTSCGRVMSRSRVRLSRYTRLTCTGTDTKLQCRKFVNASTRAPLSSVKSREAIQTLKLFPSAPLSHLSWLLGSGHKEVGVAQWHTLVVVAGDLRGAKARRHEKQVKD